MGWSVGETLGAIAVGGSLFGAINSSKSAKDSKDEAEKRAKSLSKFADEEYALNSAELKREFTTNFRELSRESATMIFNHTVQARASKGQIMSATAMGGNGLEGSSFRTDATAVTDNGVRYSIASTIAEGQFMANEMTHSYNKNMAQLRLDRDKMSEDIGYSLNRAEVNADNMMYRAWADVFNTAGSTFPTYFNYKDVMWGDLNG